MKKCSKCNKEKKKKEFSKDTGKDDKLFVWCRQCCIVYRRQHPYTEKQLTNKRRKDKEYQKRKRKNQKGYKTEEYRIWRMKNPEKYKAHGILNYAIKKGEIKRLPCVVCGATYRIAGHHPNYSNPLKVIWVCSIHHKKFH